MLENVNIKTNIIYVYIFFTFVSIWQHLRYVIVWKSLKAIKAFIGRRVFCLSSLSDCLRTAAAAVYTAQTVATELDNIRQNFAENVSTPKRTEVIKREKSLFERFLVVTDHGELCPLFLPLRLLLLFPRLRYLLLNILLHFISCFNVEPVPLLIVAGNRWGSNPVAAIEFSCGSFHIFVSQNLKYLNVKSLKIKFLQFDVEEMRWKTS